MKGLNLQPSETEGFRDCLKGKAFLNNPYNNARTYEEGQKYKDWCSGFRKARGATKEELQYVRWVYSMSDLIDKDGVVIKP